MAQFPEVRRRLARFRRILEKVLVVEALVLSVSMIVIWLLTTEAVWLLLAIVAFALQYLGIWALRRDLCPDEDLLRTVRLLNAKKKFYRKHLGIRFRFSAKWFPFPEFTPISDVPKRKAP